MGWTGYPGRRFAAVLQFDDAFGDDLILRGEAGLDDPEAADAAAHFHSLEGHFAHIAFFGDDIDVVLALHLLHGSLRQKQGTGQSLRHDADAAELARTKDFFGIREFDAEFHGARGGIHGAVHEG